MSEHPTAILPIGKFKGKPIEVLRDYPEYREWLMGQDWFRQKYPNLVQIVINNFSEPENTPEHNRIQARFLDDAFCRAFFSCFASFRDPRTVLDRRLAYEQEQAKMYANPAFAAHSIHSNRKKEADEELEKLKSALAKFDQQPPTKPYPIHIEYRGFEVQGWDVALGGYMNLQEWQIHESGRMFIEVKTSVGDDYPAVLRQMKSNVLKNGDGETYATRSIYCSRGHF